MLTIGIRGIFGIDDWNVSSIGLKGILRMSNEKKEAINEKQIETIKEIASSIQFGKITLVFQDGFLVQIETTEKVRVK